MLKYILTHPIQYQSPLIKYLSKKINIRVVYRSDISLKKNFDKDFNKSIIIDKNLLNGYTYSFLNYIGPNKVNNIFPLTTEFIKNIFLDNSKIIWVHGIKNWYNLIIIVLAKFYKKKVFVRDEINILRKRSSLNLFLNKIFFTFIDNFVDCYLTIGNENTKAYLYFGINSKKIHLVPYVVDNNFFFIKKKIINKKIKILFTGKLMNRKGCDILLEAINHLNKRINSFKEKTIVTIVGEGKLKKELMNYKKKKKLSNVKFVGFKNQKQIKKYYKQSNIFIMPSREENWGLAINEAMSAKNIIIASDKVGAVKDLVKNGYNGYIFENNNYINLADKILLIFKNIKKINKLSQNSYNLISKWSFKQCYMGLNKAINFVFS